MNQTTAKNVFVLGREEEICFFELKSVLNRFDICFSASATHGRDGSNLRISGNLVFANIENFSDNDAKKLIGVLGGTIKIFRIKNQNACHSGLDPESIRIDPRWSLPRTSIRGGDDRKGIQNDLVNIISSRKSGGKINFGISDYSNTYSVGEINRLGLTVKNILKRKNISSRFVALKDSNELSSIQSLKNNLDSKGVEFGIFDEGIGILVVLNNPESWNERDYGKPAADKFSGMLPPKLARMMINLALGEISSRGVIPDLIRDPGLDSRFHGNDKVVVIDPFCGSGSVLLEGLMLGCNVIGSDASERAVNNAKKNISWLKSQILNPKSQTNPKFKIPNSEIFQADATKYDFKRLAPKGPLWGNKQLAIISEPYLGAPKRFKPKFAEAKEEYLKIKTLYLSFLSDIKNVILNVSEESRSITPLDPSAMPQDDKNVVVCLVFPLVETLDGDKLSLYNECVDEIRILGYTQQSKPLVYGRDYQVVKREIVLLRIGQQKTKIQ